MQPEYENEDDDDQQQRENIPTPPTTTSTTTPTPASASASVSTLNALMSPPEEDAMQQKRRAIQTLMRDSSLTDKERRLRIQGLMDNSNPQAIRTQLQQEHREELQQAAADGRISSTNAEALQTAVAAGSATLPCIHYERNCNIVAPCCGKVFGCRVCHDEFTNLAHGRMDRFQVSEVVCKKCGLRQPTSNRCINANCSVVFAEYHCDICNLWMEESKQPFHCDKCGFCRVGGRTNFRHCDRCAMCISASQMSDNSHKCVRDKYKNNCPVCREDMYTSRHVPQDLPCGHAIHSHCFRMLAGFDYRCPICKKTVVAHESMAGAWAQRAMEIERQPMPGDLSRVVDIICNDCEVRSSGMAWHFLGVQCPACQSFNTVVDGQNNTNNSNSNTTTGGGGGGGGGGGTNGNNSETSGEPMDS